MHKNKMHPDVRATQSQPAQSGGSRTQGRGAKERVTQSHPQAGRGRATKGRGSKVDERGGPSHPPVGRGRAQGRGGKSTDQKRPSQSRGRSEQRSEDSREPLIEENTVAKPKDYVCAVCESKFQLYSQYMSHVAKAHRRRSSVDRYKQKS